MMDNRSNTLAKRIEKMASHSYSSKVYINTTPNITKLHGTLKRSRGKRKKKNLGKSVLKAYPKYSIHFYISVGGFLLKLCF